MQIQDLITRYDGRVPRYTSYPTAPHFQPQVSGETYGQWLEDLGTDHSLSIYLHVPFCDRLCLYCGCNTAVMRRPGPRRDYADLLLQEIDMVADRIGHRARVGHIHWGGGTPTTLPPDSLIAIMDRLRARFDPTPQCEIAIEIDPTTFSDETLAALGPMGVNRASLGVQDFETSVQRAIGREQSFAQTANCVDRLRAKNIASLNLDLIYGLPRQTEESVARTAWQTLALGADRIAVFGYAHVPWMKRHQALIKDTDLPGALDRYQQQDIIAEVLTQDGGYSAIGLDHYALPEDKMAQALDCGDLRRSFQGYTTDSAPVLIGFGASAIGCLPQGYVQNATSAVDYSRALKAGHFATARGRALTADDKLRRAVIERIMCDMQVDLRAVAREFNADPDPLFAAARALEPFEADGLAHFAHGRIRVSAAGRPFLRNVAALFDAYLNPADTAKRHAQAV